MQRARSTPKRIAIAFLAVTLYAYIDYFRTFSFIDLLPHLTRYEKATGFRVSEGIAYLLLGYLLLPRLRRFLQPPRLTRRWLPLLLLLLFELTPYLSQIYSFRHDLSDLARAFYWVFAIGFFEETLSRLLIFGLLNRYVGLWPAIIISSLNFGMMHFGNLHADGQGLQETMMQVIGAASFGFLAISLMLYFKSIWVPIAIHAITDLSLSVGPIRPSATQHSGGLNGHGLGFVDWIALFLHSSVNIGIGLALLMGARLFNKMSPLRGFLYVFFNPLNSSKSKEWRHSPL